ncbi:hypothetical protein OH686_18460 [Pseudomonas sp. SO81]|nr:hypothetical protein OH686_18460 [Pseudomonas sp. SO81]
MPSNRRTITSRSIGSDGKQPYSLLASDWV